MSLGAAVLVQTESIRIHVNRVTVGEGTLVFIVLSFQEAVWLGRTIPVPLDRVRRSPGFIGLLLLVLALTRVVG